MDPRQHDGQDILAQVRQANRMSAQRYAEDWLAKARHAEGLAASEPWPAWSTGETLAVALILYDIEGLADLGYTKAEAYERLRHDLGLNLHDAIAWFGELRVRLDREGGQS